MKRFIMLFLLVSGLLLVVGCGGKESSPEEIIAKYADCTLRKDVEGMVTCFSDRLVLEKARKKGIETKDIQQARKQLAAKLKEDIETHKGAHPVETKYQIENKKKISNSKCEIEVSISMKTEDGAEVTVKGVYIFVKENGKWLIDGIR